MNTISIENYKPAQKLHPLSLLAQLISRSASGCLQISSGGGAWFLHLEQGKLVYATDLTDPFGRLDRHLRRLSAQATHLVSAVRVQVRLMFEMPTADQPTQNNDYRAICWLVEQQHLTAEQAALLIESLSREVVDAFLPIQTGSYELVEADLLAEFPKFCQLDLRSLLEESETQLRQRQTAAGRTPKTTDRFDLTTSATALSKPLQKTLDAANAETHPAPAPAESVRPAQRVPNAKVYTIACIDDSPTVLQSINAFLDDKSFSVVLINDPIKALMQIIRSKPDLILLDVTMPNLDGYELCSLLRKHPNFRNTPVVMVTGNTGFIDRAKAKLVGASGYLTKPFTQTDLIKMVFKHLG
jgi:two-component system, chemotaxis family, response regulator PixG